MCFMTHYFLCFLHIRKTCWNGFSFCYVVFLEDQIDPNEPMVMKNWKQSQFIMVVFKSH